MRIRKRRNSKNAPTRNTLATQRDAAPELASENTASLADLQAQLQKPGTNFQNFAALPTYAPQQQAAPLQAKASGGKMPPAMRAIAQTSSSNGKPLPRPIQRKMEGAFGADFSDVRIHQGSQAKSIGAIAYTQSGIPFQTKLTVGAAGDKYEQEADQVAAAVVNHLHSPTSDSGTNQQSVQREEAPEEELQMKPTLQRMGQEGGLVSDDIENEIQNARGSGQALAPDLQTQMGQAMGADFSGVRVHTDARADVLNRSVGARAFTTGQDVFFKQGEYQPGRKSGQELIAHELTHVKQQTPVGIQRQGDSKPPPEVEEKLEEEGGYIQAKHEVSPTQSTTYIQRAYTARRPLGGSLKGIGSLASKPWIKNKGIYHEHIFFDGNLAPMNWGFMGKNGCGEDDPKYLNKYTKVKEGFDDELMMNAINFVEPGTYELFGNNCQRYVEKVLEKYKQFEGKPKESWFEDSND